MSRWREAMRTGLGCLLAPLVVAGLFVAWGLVAFLFDLLFGGRGYPSNGP